MELKYYIYIKNSRESDAGQLKVSLANLFTFPWIHPAKPTKRFQSLLMTFAISVFPSPTEANTGMQDTALFLN